MVYEKEWRHDEEVAKSMEYNFEIYYNAIDITVGEDWKRNKVYRVWLNYKKLPRRGVYVRGNYDKDFNTREEAVHYKQKLAKRLAHGFSDEFYYKPSDTGLTYKR